MSRHGVNLLVMLLAVQGLVGVPCLLASDRLNETVEVEQQAELGRKVEAVRYALQHPDAPHALKAITDLGHDQRYYVMVRGWLAHQLQGDRSIAAASRGQVPEEVGARIRFIERAIRAIDLE